MSAIFCNTFITAKATISSGVGRKKRPLVISKTINALYVSFVEEISQFCSVKGKQNGENKIKLTLEDDKGNLV